MWKHKVNEQTEKLFERLPDNRFIQVDGQLHMMITPKELVEYSHSLLQSWNDAQLDSTWYDRENAQEGLENAIHDK